MKPTRPYFFLRQMHQTDTGGRFATVLSRRGDENILCHGPSHCAGTGFMDRANLVSARYKIEGRRPQGAPLPNNLFIILQCREFLIVPGQ